MALSLPFRSALVTGASSGIGAALVRRLASAGVPTVVVARRRDRLEALAEELPGIEVLAADLTRPDQRRPIEARLADRERPIELLVNNAGFGTSGGVATVDSRRLADEVRLNALALTLLSRAVLPVMLERRQGWLLNVSSVVSLLPVPDLATYAATKAYVTSFTDALRAEVRGSGVHVTTLLPGLTRTEFAQVSNVQGRPMRRVPAAWWQDADEVAAVGLADVVRNRARSVPGAPNRALVAAAGVLPPVLLRALATGARGARSR